MDNHLINIKEKESELPRSIVILHHSTVLGGAELVLLQLMRQLNEWGIKIYMLLENEGPLENDFKKSPENLIIVKFPYPGKPFTWRHLFCLKKAFNSLIKTAEYPISLLSADVYSLWTLLHARGRSHLPIISLWQGEYRFDDDSCVRKWIKYGANKADILVSSLPVCTHANTTGLLKKDVQALNPQIESDRFEPNKYDRNKIRKNLHIEKNEKIAIIVGRLGEGKGQYWLATEFLKNQELLRNWTLLIVGPNETKEPQHIDKILEKNVQNKIRYLGSRNDVPELLSTSDLAIFPGSLNESFGLAVCEAILMNIPILAFDAGAISSNLGKTYPGLFNINDKDKFIQQWENLSQKDALSTLKKMLPQKEIRHKLSKPYWQSCLQKILNI